jgi:hypothetical protein
MVFTNPIIFGLIFGKLLHFISIKEEISLEALNIAQTGINMLTALIIYLFKALTGLIYSIITNSNDNFFSEALNAFNSSLEAGGDTFTQTVLFIQDIAYSIPFKYIPILPESVVGSDLLNSMLTAGIFMFLLRLLFTKDLNAKFNSFKDIFSIKISGAKAA